MRRLSVVGAAAASAALLSAGAFAAFSSAVGCGADVCVGDSWQAAYVAALSSSDRIVTVQGGTHPGQQLDRVAGAAGPRVLFTPADANSPVVVQGGLTSGRSGGSVTTATGAAFVELRNIRVTGEVALKWGSDDWQLDTIDAANLRLTSVRDVQVLDSDFGPYVNQVATINSAGNGAPGVFNVLIDGVYFHDYTINDPAKHAECMQIWPGAESSNITIRNTDFRNCTDFGVLVKAPKLSNLVFDTVTLDEPMPGNVATVECNPNCARGGSSIRFSSYAYPGAKVLNSRMAGALSIDVPGYVEVMNTCTRCDPGPVGKQPPPPSPVCSDGVDNDGDGLVDYPQDPGCTSADDSDETDPPQPPPPACDPGTLELHMIAQDATTITLGWDPRPTGDFLFFYVDGAPVSWTRDGTQTSARFAKGGTCYRVEARGLDAAGEIAG